MKSRGYRTGLSLAVSACTVSVVVAMFACSSSSAPPPPPLASAGQCATNPGEFPAPNCLPFAPDAEVCTPASTACNTMPCTGSSACLAMADNSGQSVANLRMRKLLVTAPPALAFRPPSNTFVQKTVIDEGINLDYQCGEGGTGTFNWLIQMDTVNNKVTTGCAPPTMDPFGTGYCFVNATIEGLKVGPVTVDLTTNSDGSYSSATIPKLYVPIFVASSAVQMGTTAPSVVVLPLSNAAVKNVTLSADHNCIGSYNSNAVTPQPATPSTPYYCIDTDDTSCVRWTTAGSLGGLITVADADGVDVPQLNESLCVLLASPANAIVNPTTMYKSCPKDGSGNLSVMGDFCSTTNQPGGCADSYWLSATFAASAAKISATPNQAACMGEVIGGDGGVGESGSPADAGGQ
jgi:hypothetical protein